jgi:hypothetical protein
MSTETSSVVEETGSCATTEFKSPCCVEVVPSSSDSSSEDLEFSSSDCSPRNGRHERRQLNRTWPQQRITHLLKFVSVSRSSSMNFSMPHTGFLSRHQRFSELSTVRMQIVATHFFSLNVRKTFFYESRNGIGARTASTSARSKHCSALDSWTNGAAAACYGSSRCACARYFKNSKVDL